MTSLCPECNAQLVVPFLSAGGMKRGSRDGRVIPWGHGEAAGLSWGLVKARFVGRSQVVPLGMSRQSGQLLWCCQGQGKKMRPWTEAGAIQELAKQVEARSVRACGYPRRRAEPHPQEPRRDSVRVTGTVAGTPFHGLQNNRMDGGLGGPREQRLLPLAQQGSAAALGCRLAHRRAHRRAHRWAHRRAHQECSAHTY